MWCSWHIVVYLIPVCCSVWNSLPVITCNCREVAFMSQVSLLNSLVQSQVPRMLVTWAVHRPMVVEYHTSRRDYRPFTIKLGGRGLAPAVSNRYTGPSMPTEAPLLISCAPGAYLLYFDPRCARESCPVPMVAYGPRARNLSTLRYKYLSYGECMSLWIQV